MSFLPNERIYRRVGFVVAAARMRRAEQGHRHNVGVYLGRYAQDSAWRENHRRVDNGTQARGVVGLALACKPSVDFCGYWQRAARPAAEGQK